MFGLFYCYIENRDGDDRDFIERFICIGLPVLVRTIAVTVLIGLCLVILALVLAFNVPEESTPVDLLLISALQIYFYLRLARSIRLAAS